MVKRLTSILCLLIFCFTASAAYAFELPTVPVFEPTPNDLSVWYLGNIFGSDLVPGSNVPNMQLLGKLFGIFNQLALVVTIIIVSYTVFAGALNTASEGKALGEKWNAVWMPIRIVAGIALLVPKAGTGYCLAQYIVMWLILLGIGFADQIWGKMVDYFEAGGAVSVTAIEDKPLLFSYDNMNYTYALQTNQSIGGGNYGDPKTQDGDILKSMVCIQAYNNDLANEKKDKYKAYLGTMPKVSNIEAHSILMFGNQKNFDSNNPVNKNQNGAECGYIKYHIDDELSGDEEKKVQERADIYMSGLLLMANKLDNLAEIIATTTDTDDPITFPKEYVGVQRAMQIYVQYIASFRTTLGPVREKNQANLQLYKEFGWILAGNYYAVLANFRAKATLMEEQFVVPDYPFDTKGPISNEDPNDLYGRASSFYSKDYFAASPDPMYTVPGSEYMVEQEASQSTQTSTVSPINRQAADKLKKAISDGSGGTSLTSVTQDRVKEFMKYLTGTGSTTSNLSSQNPIMNAAKYGKMLTEAAVGMMIAFGTTNMILNAAIPMRGWVSYGAAAGVLSSMLTPLMLALGGFMYAQGAVLGIFIPLIPYVTFLTGVIGYMLAVVESIAAAPLVCMGLIFPETKDEIWGRAAPAYMLMLNLVLRPSLMIIGFAAAMILMWILTEILNIGFLALMGAAFQTENMFGFVSILTVYVMVFTYIVTEAYSLINVVPNRVLAWVGDQSMGVKGAKEAIGAAKQGTDAGAGAVVGGLEFSQKADMYRAVDHAGKALDAHTAQKTTPSITAGHDAKSKQAEAVKTRFDELQRARKRREGGGDDDDDAPEAIKKGK